MNQNNNQQKQQVQTSITDFVSINENTDCLQQKKKKCRRKKKPDCLEQSIVTPKTTSNDNKKRTPPSIEGKNNTKRALVFDVSSDSLTEQHSTPVSDTTYISEETLSASYSSTNMTGATPKPEHNPTTMEERLLIKLDEMISSKISPIQTGMTQMQESVNSLVLSQKAWESHQTEFIKLKESNRLLEDKVTKLETVNNSLDIRLKLVEEQLGGCNIIISGLAEVKWEREDITRNRVHDVVSETIDANDYNTRLAEAKRIDIVSTKRLGPWNKFKGRPVLVTLRRKSDAEAIMKNRKHLPDKVFIDYEYDAETTRARRLLRPIFNKARKLPEYKGKCKMDGDALVLHGKRFTSENLKDLPDNLNCQQLSSEKSQNVIGFFGELNCLSNFYRSQFELDGIKYHSAEQFIQRQKAILFKKENIVQQIEKCSTALECKQLSRNIVNFDQELWLSNAKSLCEPGIFAKFAQCEYLREKLLATENLTLVESSYDKHWGTGIPLKDDRCLVPNRWHTQGLLGIILQNIRTQLRNTTSLTNHVSTTETEMVHT